MLGFQLHRSHLLLHLQESKEHKIDEWEDLEFRDFNSEALILETDRVKPRPNAGQWIMGSFFEALSPYPTAWLYDIKRVCRTGVAE